MPGSPSNASDRRLSNAASVTGRSGPCESFGSLRKPASERSSGPPSGIQKRGHAYVDSWLAAWGIAELETEMSRSSDWPQGLAWDRRAVSAYHIQRERAFLAATQSRDLSLKEGRRDSELPSLSLFPRVPRPCAEVPERPPCPPRRPAHRIGDERAPESEAVERCIFGQRSLPTDSRAPACTVWPKATNGAHRLSRFSTTRPRTCCSRSSARRPSGSQASITWTTTRNCRSDSGSPIRCCRPRWSGRAFM